MSPTMYRPAKPRPAELGPPRGTADVGASRKPLRPCQSRQCTARTIFRCAGRYLSVGLSTVINLFDPSLIILTGERMRFDYLYAAETLAELDNLVISTGRPRPPIESHAWGDLLWAHGAAAIGAQQIGRAAAYEARGRCRMRFSPARATDRASVAGPEDRRQHKPPPPPPPPEPAPAPARGGQTARRRQAGT